MDGPDEIPLARPDTGSHAAGRGDGSLSPGRWAVGRSDVNVAGRFTGLHAIAGRGGVHATGQGDGFPRETSSSPIPAVGEQSVVDATPSPADTATLPTYTTPTPPAGMTSTPMLVKLKRLMSLT